jgi:hypothetical protein
MAKSLAAPTFSSASAAESSSGSPDTSIAGSPPSALQTNTDPTASSFFSGNTPSEDELNAIFGSSEQDRAMVEELQRVRQRSETQHAGNALEAAGIATTGLDDFKQRLWG